MSKKRFKKVYIEITNACNLTCSFCIKNKRHVEYINYEKFKILLERLDAYTDYLYFHVLGEPLIHPLINEFIDIASKRFNVQITTNGYLINKIKDQKGIRQVNISLHSFDDKYKVSIEEYMNNIFQVVDTLVKNNTYVSLRLWVKNKYQNKMIELLDNYYNCKIDFKQNNYKINKYLFVNQFHEFIWPDIENNYYNEEGTCYALRDHIGVLVDGTIVPCCLDTKGAINLGNIYESALEDILKSDRVREMLEGFQQYRKKEELCKHCSFIE